MIVRQFLTWAETASDETRAKAISALARAYVSADFTAQDRHDMEAAIPALAADPSAQVRFALADALSRHPLVPADIVMLLARLPGEAGQTVTSHSPVLNARELIVLCETGDARCRCAVARRAELSAPVAAALSEIGDEAACLALVANLSADVPGFALGRIVARHGHVAAIREALLERPDLPATAHQAVIGAVAGAMSACEAEAQQEAGAASEEAVGRDPGRTRAMVEGLQASGELSAALALRALLAGEIRLFVEAVSVLADLPTERVAALTADRTGDAFRVLYNRIGLPTGAYIAFRSALEVIQCEAYVDEVAESELKRRIMERVLASYSAAGAMADAGRLVGLLEQAGGEVGRRAA